MFKKYTYFGSLYELRQLDMLQSVWSYSLFEAQLGIAEAQSLWRYFLENKR